jgi:hypothetical protein
MENEHKREGIQSDGSARPTSGAPSEASSSTESSRRTNSLTGALSVVATVVGLVIGIVQFRSSRADVTIQVRSVRMGYKPVKLTDLSKLNEYSLLKAKFIANTDGARRAESVVFGDFLTAVIGDTQDKEMRETIKRQLVENYRRMEEQTVLNDTDLDEWIRATEGLAGTAEKTKRTRAELIQMAQSALVDLLLCQGKLEQSLHEQEVGAEPTSGGGDPVRIPVKQELGSLCEAELATARKLASDLRPPRDWESKKADADVSAALHDSIREAIKDASDASPRIIDLNETKKRIDAYRSQRFYDRLTLRVAITNTGDGVLSLDDTALLHAYVGVNQDLSLIMRMDNYEEHANIAPRDIKLVTYSSSRFEDLQEAERDRLKRYYNQQAAAALYVMDNSGRPIESNRTLFADGQYDASLQSLVAAAAGGSSQVYEPLLEPIRSWWRSYGVLSLLVGLWLLFYRRQIGNMIEGLTARIPSFFLPRSRAFPDPRTKP